MRTEIRQAVRDRFARPFRRRRLYSVYAWSREMPRSKRLITWAGLLLQGYAIYSLCMRSLIWPKIWPEGRLLYACAFALYALGLALPIRFLGRMPRTAYVMLWLMVREERCPISNP